MGLHLAWQVGNGENILLGIDPIVGFRSSYSLPEDLRSYLEDLNVCSLAQARNTLSSRSYWYTLEDLDIGGSYSTIWNNYIESLIGAGIRLSNSSDDLVWTYKKNAGSITAKAVYDCIVFSHSPPAPSPAESSLWNRALPNKISCFIWLSIRNRILTWENLQKRGYHGHGICVLCCKDEETVEHLFNNCRVWRMVAIHVCDILNLTAFAPSASIGEMIKIWNEIMPKNSPFHTLPFHMM